MIFDSPTFISQTIASGSLEVTGSARFANGLSGSLTRLPDGTSYLLAGPNISIVTGSNGSITITASMGGTLGGSGTTNYVPKWLSSTTLTNSQIFDDGTYVGIGVTNPSAILHVSGSSTSTLTTALIKGGTASQVGAILDVQDSTGSSILEVSGSVIEASVPIRAANGSATAPAFSFIQSTSTGMYRRTSGQLLSFAVSGNQVMGIDTNGLVGINVSATTSPLAMLQVNGASTASTATALFRAGNVSPTGAILDVQNSSATTLLLVSGSGFVGVGTMSNASTSYIFGVRSGADSQIGVRTLSGIGAGGTGAALDSLTDAGAVQNFGIRAATYQFLVSPTTLSLYIASGGNVGIGSTTTISARLQVSGSGTASTPTMVVREGVRFPTDGAATLDVQNSLGTSLLFVSGSGNVGIGVTNNTAYELQVNTASTSKNVLGITNGILTLSLGLVNANGSFIFERSNNPLRFGTNDLERVRIDASGNVGIGTTNTNSNRVAISGGNLSVSGSILPGDNATSYDLGSTAYRWRDLYARTGSFSGDVTITGNLTVAGTQTIVNSDVVNIKDNAILLNAGPSPLSTGGIYVADTTANITGSLIWDAATDQWKAGRLGSEVTLVSGSGTTNYLAKWSGANAIGTSVVYDDGTNIGIGSATPGYKLDVNGTTSTTSLRVGTSSGNALLNSYTGAVGTGFRVIANSNPQLELWHDGNSVGQFLFNNSTLTYGTHTGGGTQTERLRIDPSGNVGIGTNAFTDKLAVNGSVSISGSLLPGTDNLYNLGSPSKRWANIFATSISGSLTGSNVLAGQVVVAGTGGLISGSNNLLWNDTNTNLTVGLGTSVASDPTNRLQLSDNSTNKRSMEFRPGSTCYIVNYNRGTPGYLPLYLGASTFKFSDGTYTHYIDSTGNVGIGVSAGVSSISSRFLVTGSTASVPTMIVREGVSSPTGGVGVFDVQNSAGTSLLFVTGSGNVGIGSSNPGATLDVNAGANGRFRFAAGGTSAISDIDNFQFRSSNTFTTFMTLNGTGLGIGASPSSRLFVSGGINASTPTMVVKEGYASPLGGVGVFDVQNSAGTSILFVTGSGFVGIGTNNPTGKHHVYGVGGVNSILQTTSAAANLTVSLVNPGNTVNIWNRGDINQFLIDSSWETGIRTLASRDIYFSTNSTERVRILSGGTTAFTGSIEPGADNLYDLGSPTKRWRAIYASTISGSLTGSNVTAGQVVVAGTGGVLSGSNLFWWNNTNGNVGIGSTTAATRLDVRGVSGTSGATVQIVGNGVSTLLLGQNADGGVVRGQGGNNALSFWTGGSGDTGAGGSGSERVRIDSTGNVGIGTSTVQTYSGYTVLDIDSTTNGGLLNLKKAGSTVGYINAVSGLQVLATTGNDMYLTVAGSNAIFFRTNATDRLTINSVGVVAPGADNTQDFGSSALRWRNIFATNISGSLTGSNVTAGQVVVAGTGGVLSGSNDFYWDNSTRRVGIGTISPLGKLSVGSGNQSLVFDSTGTGGIATVQSYNGSLTINTLGNNTLFNAQGGTVGIGTTNPPASKFFVSGSGTLADTVMIVKSGVVSPIGGAKTFEVQNSVGTSLLYVSGSGEIGVGTDTSVVTSTATTTSISATTLLSISSITFRSAEFIVQGVDTTGGKYHTAKIIAVHNGSVTNFTEYGAVSVGGIAGTFNVTDPSSGTFLLQVTAASTNSTVWKTTAILTKA